MQHSAKYLIHADIRTSGVVERSDVVGAIFGQTEGLLGDELDLRDLQDASKIGRIDVDIESENGRSFGTVTIASGLDRVRTAVLAASLETIERVGPCRAECTVTDIEDARAAKRRELVDRATTLLADLEDSTMTSENLVDAVRQRARVEDITEYEGLPAGPRVADSDAIIVVEGRADVRRLLRFGIKNAVAVEGTDIPDPVARLTADRTTTALLDGDRGGDLILRELAQVGDVDYVAFAPPDRSIEDLDRSEIMSALRKKVPYDQALDADSPREAFDPTHGTLGETAADAPETSGDGEEDSAAPSTNVGGTTGGTERDSAGATDPHRTDDAGADRKSHTATGDGETATGDGPEQSTDADSSAGDDGAGSSEEAAVTQSSDDPTAEQPSDPDPAAEQPSASDGGIAESEVAGGATPSTVETGPAHDDESPDETGGEVADSGGDDADEVDSDSNSESDHRRPAVRTLQDHVADVIGEGTGRVRFLDPSLEASFEGDADEAFDAIADASEPPRTVILDGSISQRLLDVASQRGVGQIIGADTGEFVKQPTSVRVRTAGEY